MRRISQLKQKLWASVGAAAVVLTMWWLRLPCIYRALFDVSCPGCGMTRAWMAALRLDFGAAFGYHWMFWSVPVGYVYFLLDGRVIGKRWADRLVLGLLVGGFLVNWVLNPSK